MSDYVPILGFENYGISQEGRVINFKTRKILREHLSRDHVYVGLNDGGSTYPKLVSRLVLSTFQPEPFNPWIFDTPIHHDYNTRNNHVNNLSWRPRWFALKYRKQGANLDNPNVVWRTFQPLRARGLVEVFPTSKEAAVVFGVLEMDITARAGTGEGVFPDGIIFDFA